MNRLMQAKIIDRETQITKLYIVYGCHYDRIMGEDYLILDTKDDGIKRIKLDSIDTFSLSAIPPN